MQAPTRLVERLPRIEYFRRLVVDGPLILALQDVPEHRAGVPVRLACLPGLVRHLNECDLCLLTVQLLGDVACCDGPCGVLPVIMLGRIHTSHSYTDTSRER